MGIFYLAHWCISRQELSSQLLWLIPQGMNDRRHHEKCPSFPACPGIQNKEQKLIFMVCRSHWAIFPFLRWLRRNSISTDNMNQPLWNTRLIWWSLYYHFSLLYLTCYVCLVCTGCKVFGTGNVKILFSTYCDGPLSIGFWRTTTVNIHRSMVMYCPLATRSSS